MEKLVASAMYVLAWLGVGAGGALESGMSSVLALGICGAIALVTMPIFYSIADL